MASNAKTHSHHHILPLRVYLGVFAGLLVLTAVTVAVSFMHFGAFNLVVAMFIAAIKASLVAMFFMHLKYDNKLYLAVFLIAIAFLAVFIIFTMFDTMERDQIYIEKGGPIHKKAVMYDKAAIDTTGVIPGDSIGVPPDETPVDDPGD